MNRPMAATIAGHPEPKRFSTTEHDDAHLHTTIANKDIGHVEPARKCFYKLIINNRANVEIKSREMRTVGERHTNF